MEAKRKMLTPPEIWELWDKRTEESQKAIFEQLKHLDGMVRACTFEEVTRVPQAMDMIKLLAYQEGLI